MQPMQFHATDHPADAGAGGIGFFEVFGSACRGLGANKVHIRGTPCNPRSWVPYARGLRFGRMPQCHAQRARFLGPCKAWGPGAWGPC